MRTVGIIAEYNPFHNGHEYHLRRAKKEAGADFAAVVMSGDYTQRGTPAVFDKYARTKMALAGGADLVVEIPVFGSTASAADFADCGVALLGRLGIADAVCFGSESADLPALQDAAAGRAGREQESVSAGIRAHLRAGFSYPAAAAKAMECCGLAEKAMECCGRTEKAMECCGRTEKAMECRGRTGKAMESRGRGTNGGAATGNPNDILGVEYLRAIMQTGSRMQPIPIKRCDNGYHSTALSGAFASATAVRDAIARGDARLLSQAVPPAAFQSFSHLPPITFDDFSSLLNEKILRLSTEELNRHADMTSEIAAWLSRERRNFKSASGRVEQLKKRQYTYTRLNRALLHLLLGITKEETAAFKSQGSAPWIRILGFRKAALPLLSQLKKRAGAPLITKTADAGRILSPEAFPLWEKNIYVSELYRMIRELKTGQSVENEFTRQIIVMDSPAPFGESATDPVSPSKDGRESAPRSGI